MEFFDFPASKTTNQCLDKSISSQIRFFPKGECIQTMLQSTAEYLKIITKSDGFIIYQYDDILKELYLCPVKSDQEPCFPHRYKWHIDTGNTIATTVFKRLCPLLVDCYSTADLNYPYMQDIAALSPRYIMSLPLMAFGKRCFGVVEYYRQEGVQYKPIELRLCQFMLSNCAEALKQNENAAFYSNYNATQDNLQALIEAHAFNGSPGGSYYFLHQVVLMTSEITRSTISSMFFEKQGKLTKIVDTLHGFEAKQDSKNVYTIGPVSKSRMLSHFHANILSHKIHGMLRACDKIGHTDFSPLDKNIMEAITKMCTVWAILEYTCGYLKKQVSLEKTLMRLIRIQLIKAGQFGMRLRVQPKYRYSLLETWEYDHKKKVDKKRLAYEAVEMMTRIQGNFRVPEDGLHDFVVMVDQCHPCTEGVNFRTSVLITHSLYALLNSSGAVTNGEVAFTLMIAALCSNMVVDDSPTVKSAIFGRYNNFPYELMRFKVIQMLIEECELFRYYDKEKKNELFESIKVSLINMNLQNFKMNMQKLSTKLPGEELDFEIVERDQVIRPLLLKILPGLAYLMTHFRLPEFRKFFPKFFDELIDQNKSCIEIILALKWT